MSTLNQFLALSIMSRPQMEELMWRAWKQRWLESSILKLESPISWKRRRQIYQAIMCAMAWLPSSQSRYACRLTNLATKGRQKNTASSTSGFPFLFRFEPYHLLPHSNLHMHAWKAETIVKCYWIVRDAHFCDIAICWHICQTLSGTVCRLKRSQRWHGLG